jgi:hypothetical protein
MQLSFVSTTPPPPPPPPPGRHAALGDLTANPVANPVAETRGQGGEFAPPPIILDKEVPFVIITTATKRLKNRNLLTKCAVRMLQMPFQGSKF